LIDVERRNPGGADEHGVGLASTWVAILLAANAADKVVAILGTGLCDVNGVETVSNITALR
jgi:hypothetical protein